MRTSGNQVTKTFLSTQFAYNDDGVRASKTVAGDSTEYVLDLLATLPVVISDTEAVYLYGLDVAPPPPLCLPPPGADLLAGS